MKESRRPARPVPPLGRDLALLGVITAAVFAQTVGFPFLWDDNVYVVTNPHLRSTRYLGEYFTATFCAGAAKECAFYRPLVAVSYLVDYLLWGPSAPGHHLSCVALHVAVVLVFYALLLRLFARRRAALIAALFFAVHPLRVESVAFVAARTDPPAALLVLLSFSAFARFLRSGGARAARAYVLSLTAYGAALLTKEIAITLPALLLLYDVLLARPWQGLGDLLRRTRTYVPYALVAALYLLARRAALGYGTTQDLRLDELPRRVLTAPALVWEYFRLELFPYPLVIFHGRPSLLGSPELAIGAGIVFLAAYLLFLFHARRWSPGIPLGGLWFATALLPVLNLIPIPWPTVVERFSYLPSLGFALAVGLLADHVLDNVPAGLRRGLIAAGATALGLLTTLTVVRSRVWSDEILLWQDTAAKAPTFPLAHMNLGIAYQDRGDLARAGAAYQESLKYNPDNPKLHHNLATLYQETGRLDEALAAYRKLVELGQATPQAYFNLGIIYEDRDDTAQALTSYREALRRNPDYGKAHLRLGGLLADTGHPEEALHEFREAVRVDPRSDPAHLALARLLDDQGHPGEAAATYTRYLALVPLNVRQSEDYKGAEARLQELRRQHPGDN